MLAGSRILHRAFSTSRASNAKVAFIGVGNMGKHMAANLIKAGHSLKVFDKSAESVSELVKKGAAAAASASAAASDAEFVFTMLPSSPHVRQVYTESLFPSAPKGALLVDCSTIDPTVSRALAAEAAAKGFRAMDAPVSGGVGGAEAGTLTFMVGGAASDFAAVKPLLEGMGKNVVHCGTRVGEGQVAKICNNMVLGVTMNAVAEAMNLGVKLGADPAVLAKIINTSSGRCWSSEVYNPCPGVVPTAPASRGYAGGFGSALMHKDLGLALDAGRAVGAPLPTLAAAYSVYSMLLARGETRDFSVVYDFHAGAGGKDGKDGKKQ